MNSGAEKLRKAQEMTRRHFDPSLSVYLPGLFVMDGRTGKHPAVSITGPDCQLQCRHCRAKILVPMIAAENPVLLVEKCLQLSEQGNHGVLISGGSDTSGCLPWKNFIPAIKTIKQRTNLFISIHCGMVNLSTAIALKSVGVDQALIDIIGDDQTLHQVCHAGFGISRIVSSLAALQLAEIPIVPHLVCGLHFGQIRGEKNAIQILSDFQVEQIVILSVMHLPGTSLLFKKGPGASAVADIIAETRLAKPDTPISLGCARPRGNRDMEKLAIDAGINRMALPSDEAIEYAGTKGLAIRYHDMCCSVPDNLLEKVEP